MLDCPSIAPQPLTLLLGICQSHPQERNLGEVPHHSLDEILWWKQHLEQGYHHTHHTQPTEVSQNSDTPLSVR